MADDGGITLKIDADTAAYLTKMIEAGAATKKHLHDPMEEASKKFEKLGEGVKDLASEAITKLGGAVSVLGAASLIVDKTFEAWRENIKKAGEGLRDMATMAQTLIGAGRGGQSKEIIEAVDKNAPNLSAAQKNAFTASYLSGNPGASVEAIGEQAGNAQKAVSIGRDAGAYSRLAGSLDRSKVPDSGNLANYIMQFSPGNEDQVGGMIALNPGEATNIAQTSATLSRAPGKVGTTYLRKVNEGLALGMGWSQASAYARQSPEGRVAGNFLADPRNAAPSLSAASLDNEAAQAAADPNISTNMMAAGSEARTADNRAGQMGDWARVDELGNKALAEWRSTQGFIKGQLGIGQPKAIGRWQAESMRHTSTDPVPPQLMNDLVGVLKDLAGSVKPEPVRPRLGGNGEASK